MKYIVLSCLLFITSCAIQGLPPAGPSHDAMTKANVIIIETSDSLDQSFTKMTKVLHDQGYSLKYTDEQQFKLSTQYKKYGKNQIELKSKIVKTDSSSNIQLTGMVKVPQFSYRTEYGGSAKPPTTTKIRNKPGFSPAWDIMEAIAKKYPEGTLWYGRKLNEEGQLVYKN